jgi:hypothetical protein
MSRVGLNVALKLNSTQFNQELNKSQDRMRKFGADVRRQSEVLGRLGGAGLGRGLGALGSSVAAAGMGGVGGSLAAAVIPFAALVATMTAFATVIGNVNDAAANARKTMDGLAKDGKFERGMITGFTPGAAAAPTTGAKVTVAEVLASNLKPRGADATESVVDAITSYAISSSPNIGKAIAAEHMNLLMDVFAGRNVGNVLGRYQAAAFSAVAGDFGPDTANRAAAQLDEARRSNRLFGDQNAILRGN